MSRYSATVQKPHPQGYPETPKSIGEHIKRRRMDLNVSQGAVARQIAVTEESVYNWENGRSTPHLRHYPAIIAFLGFYPFDHETETFGGKIRRYKYEHGMNNRRLGELLGVDPGTVAKWERNARVSHRKVYRNVLQALNGNAAQ